LAVGKNVELALVLCVPWICFCLCLWTTRRL